MSKGDVGMHKGQAGERFLQRSLSSVETGGKGVQEPKRFTHKPAVTE